MYNFSVNISDRIEYDFEKKLIFATELGINNIELDENIMGKALYEMTGEETEQLRDSLIDYNKKIVLLTTALKPDDKENLKLLFRKANTLRVKGIKIKIKPNDDLDYITKLSKMYSIELFVENELDSFPKDENEMFEAAKNNSQIKLIFDPLQFVYAERHPFFHAYYASKIKNLIGFLRIKDGLYRVHQPIMLYHGCAEVKELASIMLSRSFDGYFSFTDYLPDMTKDDYKEVISIFKQQLKNM